MNPQTIKQAIEYAKADPESQFATELRKRIESGSLDNELHNAGLSEFATKPQGNNLAGGFLRSVTAPALRAGQLVGKEVAGFIGGEEARQRAEQAIQQPTTIPGLGRGTTFPGLKPEGQGRGKQLAGETLESAVSFAPYGRIAGALSKAGLSKAGANILTGLVGGYTADVAMNMQQDKTLSQTLTPGIGTAIGGAIPAIPALVRAGRAIVAPKKTVEKAVGEILQGKPEDVSRGIKALKEIDLKNINTFSELSTKFDEKIKELSSVVDNELAKDTTRYGFDDFLVTQSTKGGQEVNTNFVVRALQDLQELYTSIGDDVSRAEIDEFVERVSKDGVTKKEINDLARLYGEEFSSKAFSKTGDPLTSVNAQRFENTRSGLKTTARLSIGGKEAKLADEKMSAIFRAKELSDKMVNKVNELKQKVNERGLLEQIGRGAVKFIDTITGGTVRGAVGGLLPRGVGNKVMNALDIEEALRKNLDVIDNALNAIDDSAIIKALKNLKFPGDIIDEQTNIINKTKEFIDNPKLGLSIEDVSKKAGSVSDDLMKEARKYKSAEEFVRAKSKFKTGDIKNIDFENSPNSFVFYESDGKNKIVFGSRIGEHWYEDTAQRVVQENSKLIGFIDKGVASGDATIRFFRDNVDTSTNKKVGSIEYVFLNRKSKVAVPEMIISEIKGQGYATEMLNAFGEYFTKNGYIVQIPEKMFTSKLMNKVMEKSSYIKENGVWFYKTKSQLEEIWKRANQN